MTNNNTINQANSAVQEALSNIHQAYELALLRADKNTMNRIEAMSPNIEHRKIISSNPSTRPIFYWLDHILNLDIKEKKSLYLKDLSLWLDKTIDYIKKHESDDDYACFFNNFYFTSGLEEISVEKIDDNIDSEIYFYLSVIATNALQELNAMSEPMLEKLKNANGFNKEKIGFVHSIYRIGLNRTSTIMVGLNQPDGLYYDFKLEKQLDLVIEKEFNSIDYSQDFVKCIKKVQDLFFVIEELKIAENKMNFFYTFYKSISSIPRYKKFQIR